MFTKRTFLAILFISVLGIPAFSQKIQTIRVAPIVANYPNDQDFANLVTAKLITHLVGAGVSVIEGESDTPTDAVLHVAFTVRGPQTGFDGSHVDGPVRLTDTQGKVVWADEIRSNNFARNASSSFAENLARKLEAFLASKK